MAFDGTGNFARLYNWTNDRNAMVKITASRVDAEDNGFAAGLSNCVTRDGQSPATANIPFGGFKATNLGTPTNSTDAATKGYVDSAVVVGQRATVVAATTGNIAISTDLNNADSIDGVSLSTGQAVLVKDQTVASQNGIYIVGASPARSSSFDTWNEMVGCVIAVTGGSTNNGTIWQNFNNTGGSLGTDTVVFEKTGSGITLPLALASGGLGVSLSDPGADRGLFFDESGGGVGYFSATTGIQFSGTTLILDINGLSSKSAPTASDFFAGYDAAGSTAKKIPTTAVALLALEDQTLAGGAVVTTKDLGTQSSGTLTLDMGARPLQKAVNGGAFTLAPGANTGSCLLDITNNGSAGAITTSGWTKVAGDSFDTTNGHGFRCACSVGQTGSLLVVQAMQ